MLIGVRNLIEEHQVLSLADLAGHLGVDPEAARGMLDVWIRKGVVAKTPLGCGDCSQCDPNTTEIYEWVSGGPRVTVTSVTLGLDSSDCHL